jgi:hypothetical protein
MQLSSVTQLQTYHSTRSGKAAHVSNGEVLIMCPSLIILRYVYYSRTTSVPLAPVGQPMSPLWAGTVEFVPGTRMRALKQRLVHFLQIAHPPNELVDNVALPLADIPRLRAVPSVRRYRVTLALVFLLLAHDIQLPFCLPLILSDSVPDLARID